MEADLIMLLLEDSRSLRENTLTLQEPCRLCPHVHVVVGLESFNDLVGCTVKLLMSRPKVRFQTRHRGLRRARTVEAHFQDASAYQT